MVFYLIPLTAYSLYPPSMAAMATNGVVFAHCTIWFHYSQYLIREVCTLAHNNNKKRKNREKERTKKKKLWRLYENGVDLWMLRLLTMPIVVYSKHCIESFARREIKNQPNIQHSVWLCVVCLWNGWFL